MDHAIVVAANIGIEDSDLSTYGGIKFGSLPQIKRLIITAQRAGIDHFTIITEDRDSPLRDLLANDNRIESSIDWATIKEQIDFKDIPYLILQSNLLTTPEALSNFIDTDVDKDDILILTDTSDDPWIKTDEDRVEEIASNGGKAVGAFIASGELLKKSFSDSKSLKDIVSERVEKGKAEYKEFSGKYWMRLSDDKDSAKKAEDLIFNYVGKTATGWISRRINSKFSLPTSRLLVKTPLTPNMISIGINIIGSLCGIFYAIGHPVIGALFMHIATVLDRCDGEVARVKLMETKKGQWVDTVSDQFTVLSFLLGVPVGYYLISDKPIALVLGGINVSIFLFFVIWSFYFLTRYTNSGSLVTYFEVDKLVEPQKTSFVRKIIKIGRPLSRRNVYSFAFILIAVVGGYPWVLGITTIAAILFFIHSFEDILKLRKVKPDKQIQN
jgi:phosphatidylglycerophosphate synthase